MPKKNRTRKSGDALWKERSSSFPPANFNEIEGWLTAARPRLLHLAYLRGISSDAIEDVVQETLLEAWKHLDRLHTPEGVHVWLDEICRNICRRHARQHVLDQQRLTPLLTASQEDEAECGEASWLKNILDPHTPDPLEALSRQELAFLLDRACRLLSANAREVVERCYLQELPQQEVAAQLGISLSALEARLHRARQRLRQVLHGPLRLEAEALGLTLDPASAGGWCETRLWCTLCGRRRLMGMFLPQPNGNQNLHLRCPTCEQRDGLSDVHTSNVHSKGLVQLARFQTFRPAWKRTMQETTWRLARALLSRESPCPYCGTRASLQVIDTLQGAETGEEVLLPAGLSHHPSQFWVWWRCPHGHYASYADVGLFAASDVVYWSHARTRHFMREHPHWVSDPELQVEYAGQPVLRFQMTDLSSSACLTVLARRQTLQVLAVFS